MGTMAAGALLAAVASEPRKRGAIESGVDLSDGSARTTGRLENNATFEATPILVDGRLYLSTPHGHVMALDPDTGKKIWEFDPKVDVTRAIQKSLREVFRRGRMLRQNRSRRARCEYFMGTIDARLIALDGETGKPCADFGVNGQVDLTKDVNLRDAATTR